MSHVACDRASLPPVLIVVVVVWLRAADVSSWRGSDTPMTFECDSKENNMTVTASATWQSVVVGRRSPGTNSSCTLTIDDPNSQAIEVHGLASHRIMLVSILRMASPEGVCPYLEISPPLYFYFSQKDANCLASVSGRSSVMEYDWLTGSHLEIRLHARGVYSTAFVVAWATDICAAVYAPLKLIVSETSYVFSSSAGYMRANGNVARCSNVVDHNLVIAAANSSHWLKISVLAPPPGCWDLYVGEQTCSSGDIFYAQPSQTLQLVYNYSHKPWHLCSSTTGISFFVQVDAQVSGKWGKSRQAADAGPVADGAPFPAVTLAAAALAAARLLTGLIALVALTRHRRHVSDPLTSPDSPNGYRQRSQNGYGSPTEYGHEQYLELEMPAAQDHEYATMLPTHASGTAVADHHYATPLASTLEEREYSLLPGFSPQTSESAEIGV